MSEKKESNKSYEDKLVSTKPLSILFTIVNNKKTDYYIDLIQNYGVNMQIITTANGTTKSSTFLSEIGNKSMIMSVIANDKIKECLSELKDKFESIPEGKGVAYTVPLTSVSGVRFYNFLANNQSSLI